MDGYRLAHGFKPELGIFVTCEEKKQVNVSSPLPRSSPSARPPRSWTSTTAGQDMARQKRVTKLTVHRSRRHPPVGRLTGSQLDHILSSIVPPSLWWVWMCVRVDVCVCACTLSGGFPICLSDLGILVGCMAWRLAASSYCIIVWPSLTFLPFDKPEDGSASAVCRRLPLISCLS